MKTIDEVWEKYANYEFHKEYPRDNPVLKIDILKGSIMYKHDFEKAVKELMELQREEIDRQIKCIYYTGIGLDKISKSILNAEVE